MISIVQAQHFDWNYTKTNDKNISKDNLVRLLQ